MTKKELLSMLTGVADNTEIRFFHNGMLLPVSTMNEFPADSGWNNTIALSGVIPQKYATRFKSK